MSRETPAASVTVISWDTAICESKLDMATKGVLHAIRYFMNTRTGVCWPSLERIAEVAGCSRRTVQTAISKAVSEGFLRADSRLAENGRQKSNLYERSIPLDLYQKLLQSDAISRVGFASSLPPFGGEEISEKSAEKSGGGCRSCTGEGAGAARGEGAGAAPLELHHRRTTPEGKGTPPKAPPSDSTPNPGNEKAKGESPWSEPTKLEAITGEILEACPRGCSPHLLAQAILSETNGNPTLIERLRENMLDHCEEWRREPKFTPDPVRAIREGRWRKPPIRKETLAERLMREMDEEEAAAHA